MAGTLKRLKAQSVGIAATNLLNSLGESGPAADKVWNIPRLYITNVHATATPLSTLTHVTGATSTNVSVFKHGVKGTSTGTIILEDIVLISGDKLQIVSDTAASIDVFGSIIEEDA